MTIPVTDPFAQVKPTWPGLDDGGHRRRVFEVADRNPNGGELLVSGLTIVEPGEVPGT